MASHIFDQNKLEMEKKSAKRAKKVKKGVVYLSCIPTSMTVKRLREEFSKYGEVGNVFLQPDGTY
jgi:hypothetical protein